MNFFFSQLFHLITQRKIFLHLTSFVGAIVFLSLSLNSIFVDPPSGMTVIFIQPMKNLSSNRHDRKEFLRNQCGNPKDPTISTVFSLGHSEIFNHLSFVLRSHSLFYCSVPKVATRTFLAFITFLHIRDELISKNHSFYRSEFLDARLKRETNSSSILEVFSSQLKNLSQSNISEQIDLWLLYQNHVFPYVRLRSLENPLIIFSSSFQRIIFVRHPFERLASAYIDKIATIQPSSSPPSIYDELRRTICRRHLSFYHNRSTILQSENDPCARVIPTFTHFIEYLSFSPAQDDVHWHPYSTLCQVCTMKYNYIGKYETIEDDFHSLLSTMNLTLSDWIHNNRYSTGRKREFYRSMFWRLPSHLLCFLKYFYRDDLRLFNYRLEDFLSPDRLNFPCSSRSYHRLN